MVFILHTASYTDTGCLLTMVTKELGLFGTDKIKIIEIPFSEVTSTEWMKHQPLQRMPWMEDTEGKIELFESRTICKYLATKVQSTLVPGVDQTAAIFKFDQMANMETTHFFLSIAWLTVELIYAEILYHRPMNADVVAIMDKELNMRVLPGYERILENQKYLCGDEITLVDFFHVFLGKPVNDAGSAQALTDGSLPNVKRWFESLTSRQSVKEAFEIKGKAYMVFLKNVKGQKA